MSEEQAVNYPNSKENEKTLLIKNMSRKIFFFNDVMIAQRVKPIIDTVNTYKQAKGLGLQ